ncbi:MAG: DUF3788 domain-containing protein [Candidatus Hodarchaeales archaeon]|jgi:hypothetical protein
MLNKTCKPDSKEIISYIGDQVATKWLEMEDFLKTHYDFKPETIFYGNKYGWVVRYRKSGRTLCSLFPEKSSFTVLITLGKKESETVLSMKDELSSRIFKLIKESRQLRDGRWLWIRILKTNDITDIKKILTVKRKPKKQVDV